MGFIAMMLPFILPIIIWAGCTLGLYLSRLYGSKHDVYWRGYRVGYEDGVKRVTRLLKQVKEHEHND